MKLPTILLSLLSLSVLNTAYAAEEYDIKCQLTDNTELVLSHSDSTVYIAFKAQGDDPEEGGQVIKLDIPSGGAQQALGTDSFTSGKYFVLRGTDEDIEGAVSMTYSLTKGKASASYSVMTSLGKELENINCKPDTIKASNDLLKNGLSHVSFMK